MRLELETILLPMRAIRYVLIVAVLWLGLPGLALAHGGHDHQGAMSTQSAVMTRHQVSITPAKIAASEHVRLSVSDAAEPVALQHTGSLRQSYVHTVFISASNSSQLCMGSCCCAGGSTCGSASCCPTMLSNSSTAVWLPSISKPVSFGSIGRQPSMVVHGLERPPKA